MALGRLCDTMYFKPDLKVEQGNGQVPSRRL